MSIGIGALFGITGIAGMGLCLLVIAGALWRTWDAEPVLIGVDIKPEPQTEEIPPIIEPEPEPEPPFVEPLDMIDLPGGTFLMGSPDSDRDALDSEKPQHKVTLSAFCISRYPVTRQLYRDIVGSTPQQWARDTDDQQLPANYVSWFDAVRFCNALSERVGLPPCYRIEGNNVEWNREADGYRLPTEAEWEYACRAGTETKWFFGDDARELGDYAWFSGNSGDRVQPVGGKKPNNWELHDMSGNVWEWCWDWFAQYPSNPIQTIADPTGSEDGDRRVLRGGSWSRVPRDLRSAYRVRLNPESQDGIIGVRCVRAPRR
jgi:formylglycine-generating enzyme required for sulfatase activity